MRRTPAFVPRAAAAVHGPLTWLLERLFVRFARPLVLENRGRPCLVVAPHPDDETLGCGATIARARAMGIDVRVAVVTDGRGHPPNFPDPDALAELRRGETLRACKLLGVAASDVEFLGFHDGRAADSVEAIEERLVAIIMEINPDRMFVPFGIDNHADHGAVAAAAARAVRRCGSRASVYAYPIWFWFPRFLLRSFTSGWVLRLAHVPTASFLTAKARALAEFQTQGDVFGPHDRLLAGLFARQRCAEQEYFFDLSRSSAGGMP
ncbi:MAG: PIG-L deacetylase family protein [Planctomycetota bacterium]